VVISGDFRRETFTERHEEAEVWRPKLRDLLRFFAKLNPLQAKRRGRHAHAVHAGRCLPAVDVKPSANPSLRVR